MRKSLLLILLMAGCATFTQVEEVKKRETEIDLRLQEVINANVRRSCPVIICDQKVIIGNTTIYECLNLQTMVDEIARRSPSMCKKDDGVNPTSANF